MKIEINYKIYKKLVLEKKELQVHQIIQLQKFQKAMDKTKKIVIDGNFIFSLIFFYHNIDNENIIFFTTTKLI